METKKLVTFGFLFFLLIILVVIFFITVGEENQVSTSPKSLSSSEKSSAETMETQKVVLFYLSEDGYLHPEEREIPLHPSLADQAKQTVHELFRGSEEGYISPFPLETSLRELYITEKGVAYVDFSIKLREEHPSGSAAEVSTIFSIVNSLTHNFEQIKKVHVLVDGGERETLKGHVDLSRAFSSREDLVVW